MIFDNDYYNDEANTREAYDGGAWLPENVTPDDEFAPEDDIDPDFDYSDEDVDDFYDSGRWDDGRYDDDPNPYNGE